MHLIEGGNLLLQQLLDEHLFGDLRGELLRSRIQHHLLVLVFSLQVLDLVVEVLRHHLRLLVLHATQLSQLVLEFGAALALLLQQGLLDEGELLA